MRQCDVTAIRHVTAKYHGTAMTQLLVGRLVGCLAGGLLGWPAGWLTGWLSALASESLSPKKYI